MYHPQHARKPYRTINDQAALDQLRTRSPVSHINTHLLTTSYTRVPKGREERGGGPGERSGKAQGAGVAIRWRARGR